MPRRVRAGAVCSVSGCPEDATNEGRCPLHQRKRPKRTTVTVSGWEEQRRAKRVIERDGGVCWVCGLMGANEADHVIPLAQGGADDESNMAPIHSSCHAKKSEAERLAGIRKGRAQR